MSFIEVVLIGIGLSMDAFAVSVTNGLVYPQMTRRQMLSIPLAFGLFQGLMPLLGYFLGSVFGDFISQYGGVISFVILAFVGGKMLKDGFSAQESLQARRFRYSNLLIQAVATSIDAFMVGISFCATGANILFASPIIALTTFLLSLAALAAGKKLGHMIGCYAEILGGVILILIGVKALF